ncbi:hypothetical protein ANO14919_017810 [Xylariales sp. No.14919]|nr:hypothetical protein ANO14919_017810 [Xylariales sp. No.14919]
MLRPRQTLAYVDLVLPWALPVCPACVSAAVVSPREIATVLLPVWAFEADGIRSSPLASQ